MESTSHNDDYEEEGAPALDLKVLLVYGAFRSKMWVLSLGVLGFVVGLLYAGSLPNIYQSVSQVKLLPDARGGMTPAQEMGVGDAGKPYFGPGILDHLSWLKLQDGVYTDAAKDLKPSWVMGRADPAQYDGPATSQLVRSWHALQDLLIRLRSVDPDSIDDEGPQALATAAKLLRENTTLMATSDWVFTITSKSNSAEKARAINYTLASGFIGAHRESLADKNAALVEELQRKEYEAMSAVTEADEEFQEFRLTCGVFDFDTEWAAITALVQELEASTKSIRSAMEGKAEMVAHFRKRHGEMKALVPVDVQAVIGINPYWSTLTRKILDTNTELAELRSKPPSQITANAIRSLEPILEGLQTELEGVPQKVEVQPARVDMVPNDARQTIEAALVESEAQYESLKAELEGTANALVEAKTDRRKIGTCKQGHAHFDDKLERLKEAHQKVASRLLEAQAYAKLDESESSNLQLWSESSYNAEKIGPQRVEAVLAGLGLGLALGLALAVARQLFDRRVRYPETLEKSLGLRVLGVVPDVRWLRNQPKGPRVA